MVLLPIFGKIFPRNVGEMLVPSGNCFPPKCSMPPLRAKVIIPPKHQLLRNLFSVPAERGEDTEDCSLETAQGNKSWNCCKTFKNR